MTGNTEGILTAINKVENLIDTQLTIHLYVCFLRSHLIHLIVIFAEHLPLKHMKLPILGHRFVQKFACDTVVLFFWVPIDRRCIVKVEYYL